MPVDTSAPPPPETHHKTASRAGFFRRLQIGTGVLIQLALVVFILGMVNVYSFKHFKRFDFSRDNKYALASVRSSFWAA